MRMTMMRMLTVAGAWGVLLLPAGAGAQDEWAHDHDWDDRLEVRLEELGHRMGRLGERIGTAVERAVNRAVREGVVVEMRDRNRHDEFRLDLDFSGLHALGRIGEGWEGGYQEGRDFTWAGDVSTGDVVEIRGVNGPVYAEPGSGSRVEVVAEKRGRRSDPDGVRIEVVEHGNGVTVCAVYPTPRGKRENRCEADRKWSSNVERNDVEVTFRVKVPSGVRFTGRTVNGRVEALDLDADVRAHTVNGDVEVTTRGLVTARTVNGSIRASFDDPDLRSGVDFRTVNGSIRLDVPDDLNANLDAEWVNGGLETDIPFALRGRLSRRHARGQLGDGGPDLRLRTVNGSIRIR